MKRLLFFTLVLLVTSLQAQVDFKARVSRYKVSTNDRFRVSFEVSTASGKIDERSFTPPDFKNFYKIMGPAMSQEYRWINGKSSAKLSYSYTLQPKKAGSFQIGAASIKVNGKSYQTKPVKIEVVKGKAQPQQTRPQDDHKTNNISVNDVAEKAIVVAEVNKSSAYVNEAVLLTYKLYIPQGYGVSNYRETSQPQYNGFWVQNLSKNIEGPFQGNLNNKPYTYYILRKKLLFPQHDGKLTIKPLELQIDMQVPVVRNFFGMRMRDIEVKRVSLTSGKKTLQVKPLPTQGQPIDFSGAVGNFDFSVKVDKNQVNVGEPINLTLRVKGKGNLKLFDLPKLKAPEGLEVYDPKHTEHVQSTASGNTGIVQDEYVIIPNSGGKFIIPAMRFVYFDPKSKSYVNKTIDDIVILVSGTGTNQVANAGIHTPQSNQKYQASDFRFIKEKANFVSSNHRHFFKSSLFYGLLGLPVFMALVFFGYFKYLSNKVYDEKSERRKERKSLAAKYLKEAKKATNNKEAFYAHLEKAIHNFIKAKLGIDTTEMSRSNIKKQLEDKQVETHKIERLMDILNRCDMARYASVSNAKIEEDLKDAESVMNEI